MAVAAPSSRVHLSLPSPTTSRPTRRPVPASISLFPLGPSPRRGPGAHWSASHPLSFASTLSSAFAAFHIGGFGSESVARRGRGVSVVCEAVPQRQADSVKKRERQNEKRRLYNKAYKSEAKTRMKKVFKALEELRKKGDAEPEEILPIEKMIGDAYSAIDRAVRAGALHKNTGGHRKSRLARRKKAIEIRRGWYVPDSPPAPPPRRPAAIAPARSTRRSGKKSKK